LHAFAKYVAAAGINTARLWFGSVFSDTFARHFISLLNKLSSFQ
jgi:hypothetical protein